VFGEAASRLGVTELGGILIFLRAGTHEYASEHVQRRAAAIAGTLGPRHDRVPKRGGQLRRQLLDIAELIGFLSG
jgi:hypothetical protein